MPDLIGQSVHSGLRPTHPTINGDVPISGVDRISSNAPLKNQPISETYPNISKTNPIQTILEEENKSIEPNNKTMTTGKIAVAYGLIDKIIERTKADPVLTPKTDDPNKNLGKKLNLLLDIIRKEFKISGMPNSKIDQFFLLEGLTQNPKRLDCDTTCFLMAAVAHELGWKVEYGSIPNHQFIVYHEQGKDPMGFEATYEKDRLLKLKDYTENPNLIIKKPIGDLKINQVFISTNRADQLISQYCKNSSALKNPQDGIKQLKTIEALYQNANGIEPNNPRTLMGLGQVYFEMGRLKNASNKNLEKQATIIEKNTLGKTTEKFTLGSIYTRFANLMGLDDISQSKAEAQIAKRESIALFKDANHFYSKAFAANVMYEKFIDNRLEANKFLASIQDDAVEPQVLKDIVRDSKKILIDADNPNMVLYISSYSLTLAENAPTQKEKQEILKKELNFFKNELALRQKISGLTTDEIKAAKDISKELKSEIEVLEEALKALEAKK